MPRRMAAAKAAAVARTPGALVLAADTVVAAGRRILPKAEDEDEARAALTAALRPAPSRPCARSRWSMRDGRARHRLSTSIVAFKRLSEDEIAAYLASGEWRGKAGGYAIQGRAEALIRRLAGSHSGVVGLPLAETRALLPRRPAMPLG